MNPTPQEMYLVRQARSTGQSKASSSRALGIGFRWRRASACLQREFDGVRSEVRLAAKSRTRVYPTAKASFHARANVRTPMSRSTALPGRRLHPTGVENPGRESPSHPDGPSADCEHHGGHGDRKTAQNASAD